MSFELPEGSDLNKIEHIAQHLGNDTEAPHDLLEWRIGNSGAEFKGSGLQWGDGIALRDGDRALAFSIVSWMDSANSHGSVLGYTNDLSILFIGSNGKVLSVGPSVSRFSMHVPHSPASSQRRLMISDRYISPIPKGAKSFRLQGMLRTSGGGEINMDFGFRLEAIQGRSS